MRLNSVLLLEPFHVPPGMRKTNPKQLINKRAPFPVDYMTYAAGLIYVKTRFMATRFHSIPLGLAQISAILKREGVNTSHEPFILDAIKRSLEDSEIESRIRAHNYDQVWMSVGSQDEAGECIRYARIVKSINNTTPILVGGIFPTFYPAWFLNQSDVDMVARGPAEEIVCHYVTRHEAVHLDIPGLCYKTHEGAYRISEPAPAPDQSRLPPMDLEGLLVNQYMKDNPFANILTSRGCPFSCPFCSHTSFWGTTVQYRNLENVRDELRTLERHGCKAGFIIDSAFTLNQKHVQQFIDVYQQEGITIRLAFQTRADHFDPGMAKLCAAIKPAQVWFGGESGCPEILSRLPGKGQQGGRKHLDDMKAAVVNARAAGIMSGATFIIGLPGESDATVTTTKNFIIDLLCLGMDIADVRNLQLFPGTDFYDNINAWGLELEEGKIRLEKGDWKEVVSHRTEFMTSLQIMNATRDVQSAIMQFYRATPDYRRVMRVLNIIQFMARHERIANGLARLKNRA
jgi:radical SAM superfamily enzyme YgiQ (UPF0313 family)